MLVRQRPNLWLSTLTQMLEYCLKHLSSVQSLGTAWLRPESSPAVVLSHGAFETCMLRTAPTGTMARARQKAVDAWRRRVGFEVSQCSLYTSGSGSGFVSVLSFLCVLPHWLFVTSVMPSTATFPVQ